MSELNDGTYPEVPEAPKTGFLEESPGVASSTRLKSLIALLGALGVAWLMLTSEQAAQNSNSLYIFLALLLAAFCPQYLHKVEEAKLELKEITQAK